MIRIRSRARDPRNEREVVKINGTGMVAGFTRRGRSNIADNESSGLFYGNVTVLNKHMGTRHDKGRYACQIEEPGHGPR